MHCVRVLQARRGCFKNEQTALACNFWKRQSLHTRMQAEAQTCRLASLLHNGVRVRRPCRTPRLFYRTRKVLFTS